MHPFLKIAVQAARSAGNIILRSLDKVNYLTVIEKENSFVTEVDNQAEKIIINTIQKFYPTHSIISEERGYIEGQGFTWIIDPLDGTTNYIHGLPHFSVSIAVRSKQYIEHAVIYDPIRQEIFTASRGQGTQLNNRRLRVLEKQSSSILIGCALNNFLRLDNSSSAVIKLESLRYSGSSTLDLAYVAAGRLDGFWGFGLPLWDIAAGVLLIRESGGLVSDMQGGSNYLVSGDITAGNPKTHQRILFALKP